MAPTIDPRGLRPGDHPFDYDDPDLEPRVERNLAMPFLLAISLTLLFGVLVIGLTLRYLT